MGLFGFGKKKEKKKEPVITADTLLQAGMEEYKKCNYGNAMEHWAEAADRGSAEANYQIARMYCEGKGVEADEIMSLVWYYDAADAGHAKAKQELDALQEKYKETAAELRHRGYQSYEAGNFEEAFNLFAPAALMGEPIAQFDVYHMLLLGEGVQENQKEAFKWGLRSARQGDMDAQYGIARCYVQGIGTETSTANALEWFKKAGEQGHSTAQYNAGLYYFYGQSVPANRPEALKWFRLAAEQGDVDAQKMIDENYAEKIDKNEALRKQLEEDLKNAEFEEEVEVIKAALKELDEEEYIAKEERISVKSEADYLLDELVEEEMQGKAELQDEEPKTLEALMDLLLDGKVIDEIELEEIYEWEDESGSFMDEDDFMLAKNMIMEVGKMNRDEDLLRKPDSEKTASELYRHASVLHDRDMCFACSPRYLKRELELLKEAEKMGHKKTHDRIIEILETNMQHAQWEGKDKLALFCEKKIAETKGNLNADMKKQPTSFDEILDKMLDDELDDPDELMDEISQCEDLPMSSTSDVDDELDDFWDDINSDMEEMDKEEKRKEALLVKPDSEKTADELYEHATILHKKNQTFTWSKSKCERIIELLMLAEKKGHKEARSTAIEYLKKYAGAEKYQVHYKEKAKYELQGAQLGDPRMQYDTAQNYLTGRGVEKDKKEAVKWMEKSAEQGYEDAVYALGMMYLKGTDVKKDEKKAFDMFKKAGEDADSDIVGQLGIMYLKGIGTAKNPEKAVELLEDAWYSGCGGEVIYELGKVYYEGKLVEQDYEKAFELMEEAEDYGNVEAMYYLGMFNEKGIGTPIDMDEAVDRYEEAAQYGHEEARKHLEKLKKKVKSR